MIDIRESIKKIFLAKSDNKLVEDFARIQYHEKFKNIKKQSGTFHSYDKFEVISENTIEVHYVFGAGEYEYNDSFEVEVK